MTTLKIKFSHALPRQQKLGWIISDFERWGKSGIEHSEDVLGYDLYHIDAEGNRVRTFGIPMPVSYYDQAATDTTEGTATRKIHLEVFSKYAPQDYTQDDILRAWLGVMNKGRAFTDYGGEDGWRYNPRISRMNVVYIMGDILRKGGKNLYPVRMLKVGNYESMKAQLEEFPLLPFNANTSTRGYGGRQVDPFWFLGGNDCKVLPFYKSEMNWLEAADIRILSPYESIPNSYYPPR